MGSASPPDITQWLQAWSRGDPSALEKLAPLVYAELHRRARFFMGRERAGHSLQPTALIHEAYARLVKGADIRWEGRAHFFGIAARAMRQILVDHARQKLAAKRGGGWEKVTLDESVDLAAARDIDLLRLEEGLTRLSELDERAAKVVELRVFAGMHIREVAYVLGISRQTAYNDWSVAKMWLADAIMQ